MLTPASCDPNKRQEEVRKRLDPRSFGVTLKDAKPATRTRKRAGE